MPSRPSVALTTWRAARGDRQREDAVEALGDRDDLEDRAHLVECGEVAPLLVVHHRLDVVGHGDALFAGEQRMMLPDGIPASA